MKRSEMVAKLSDVLVQFMPNEKHDNLRNLIADVVLYEAEREGMAAPLISKEVEALAVTAVDTVERFVTIGPRYEIKQVHEWEPEHEEK